MAMDLNAANADALAGWEDLQFIFGVDGSGYKRSSYNRAETFHGKDAIDRQTGYGLRVARLDFHCRRHQRALQHLDSGAGQGTDGEDGIGPIEEGPAKKVFHFEADRKSVV